MRVAKNEIALFFELDDGVETLSAALNTLGWSRCNALAGIICLAALRMRNFLCDSFLGGAHAQNTLGCATAHITTYKGHDFDDSVKFMDRHV